MATETYSCSLRGRCEVDRRGMLSHQQCIEQCDSVDNLDVRNLIIEYEPTLALSLAPSDRVLIINKTYDISALPENSYEILEALDVQDLFVLARYSETYDYLLENYSEYELGIPLLEANTPESIELYTSFEDCKMFVATDSEEQDQALIFFLEDLRTIDVDDPELLRRYDQFIDTVTDRSFKVKYFTRAIWSSKMFQFLNANDILPFWLESMPNSNGIDQAINEGNIPLLRTIIDAGYGYFIDPERIIASIQQHSTEDNLVVRLRAFIALEYGIFE